MPGIWVKHMHVQLQLKGNQMTMTNAKIIHVQVVLRAPPWDAADMLAVLKKNMSFSQHNNAPLWRSHADTQAALKIKHQPTSLSAVTDLASHVSSLLLALPLPSKSDQS